MEQQQLAEIELMLAVIYKHLVTIEKPNVQRFTSITTYLEELKKEVKELKANLSPSS